MGLSKQNLREFLERIVNDVITDLSAQKFSMAANPLSQSCCFSDLQSSSQYSKSIISVGMSSHYGRGLGI